MRVEQPIHTIDDLAFEFGRQALFRRWLASVLDMVVLGAVIGGIIRLIPALHEQGASGPIMIGILVWFCYFFILEARWGATVGKLLVDIRVMDEHGNAPGMGKTAIRTVTRLIEANPALFGSGIAAISIFQSSVSQRIGDRLAHTYVLRRTDLSRIVPASTNPLTAMESL